MFLHDVTANSSGMVMVPCSCSVISFLLIDVWLTLENSSSIGIEGLSRRVQPRLFSVLFGRLCHSTIFFVGSLYVSINSSSRSLVYVCHVFKPSAMVSPLSIGACSSVLFYRNQNPLIGFIIQGLVCM